MTKEEYKEVQIGPKEIEIPKEWETKKIAEVCKNRDNEREPVKSSNREKGPIPYYGATGQVDSVNDYIFDDKLVLIGEDGADWSGLANTAYIIEGKSWVNNHAHVLKCEEINEEYLKNLINLMDLSYTIVGTNRGKLNKKDLMNLEIVVPPLPEQRNIAEILSTVDEAIQQTDEIIEKSKQLKKGLMQDLLTKGIEHDKFKKVKLGPKEVDIPLDWHLKNMGKLSNKIKGKKPKKIEEGKFKNSIPYILIENFDSEEKTQYADKESSKICKENDVLMVWDGASAGDVSIGNKGSIGSTLAALRFKEEKLNPWYAYYFLIHSKNILASLLEGTGIPHVPKDLLNFFDFLIPPLPEQKKIAEILSTVDDKIQKEKNYKEKLQELKKGLMQDLLTGKVRVNDLVN